MKYAVDSSNYPTIVYFHENAGSKKISQFEDIGTRIPFIESYVRSKVNILLVAYRGYSDSEGLPSEEGLLLDSEAIVDFIFSRKDIDPKRIFLHGRSLGGAVAIYIASKTTHKLRGVIIENTFSSISKMVDVVFPYLKYFKSVVLRNYWPSIDRIGQIKVPILFIMTVKDEIVPFSQMAELFSKAPQNPLSSRVVLDQGGHNDNWMLNQELYFSEIRAFLQQLTT